MIVQARITSDTAATVHLVDGERDLRAATLPELRSLVKQAFIDEARRQHSAVDVQIVEPDRVHHLRVEPSGRIANRVPDDRPVHGPSTDDPAAAGSSEDDGATVVRPARSHAGSPAAAPGDHDATRVIPRITDEDLASGDHAPEGHRGRHAGATSAEEPAEPLPVMDAPAPSPSTASPEPESPEDPASPFAPAPFAPAPAGTDSSPLLPGQDASPVTPAPVSPGSAPTPERAAHESDDLSRPSSFAPSPAVAPAPAPAPTPAPVGPPSAFSSAAPSPKGPSSASPSPAGPSLAGPPSAGPSSAGPSATDPSPAAPSAGAPSAVGPVGERRPPVAPPVGPDGTPLPTLEDLRRGGRPVPDAPPTRGFPAFITRLTRGAITPRPNAAERRERAEAERIRKALNRPRNIVVVNLKGGAHKTTACLMIAATLGVARGGSVLAWDNNETRGTLGWRGAQGDSHRTVRDLMDDLTALGESARASDLDRYVRHQGATRFDVLASDEDAGSAVLMDGAAFDRLNTALSRFYRIKVIDTGNNVRASNWLAAVHAADQLVIISTVREDTFNAAAWMIDELRATGYADKVDNAVTLLSHSSPQGIDKVLHRRLLHHFGAHTRAVHEVPFEKQFVDGGELDWSRVSPATKRAWLAATATIVDGL